MAPKCKKIRPSGDRQWHQILTHRSLPHPLAPISLWLQPNGQRRKRDGLVDYPFSPPEDDCVEFWNGNGKRRRDDRLWN